MFVMRQRLASTRQLKLYLLLLGISLVSGCENWDLPPVQGSVTNGLIAYYAFSGNTLDGSGNNLRGNTVNGASFGPDKNAMPNSALLLDGIDDYFEIPDDGKLRTATMSISVWIKPLQVLSSSHIYEKSNFKDDLNHQYSAKIKPHITGDISGGYDFQADVHRDNLCDKFETTIQLTAYEPTFKVNQWHHLVVMYDGQTIKIYLNGIARGQSESQTKPIDNCPGGSLRFGSAWMGDINAFNGLMDEVRIYNRGLTETEINALYQR
jgi:hypothetical protein